MTIHKPDPADTLAPPTIQPIDDDEAMNQGPDNGPLSQITGYFHEQINHDPQLPRNHYGLAWRMLEKGENPLIAAEAFLNGIDEETDQERGTEVLVEVYKALIDPRRHHHQAAADVIGNALIQRDIQAYAQIGIHIDQTGHLTLDHELRHYERGMEYASDNGDRLYFAIELAIGLQNIARGANARALNLASVLIQEINPDTASLEPEEATAIARVFTRVGTDNANDQNNHTKFLAIEALKTATQIYQERGAYSQARSALEPLTNCGLNHNFIARTHVNIANLYIAEDPSRYALQAGQQYAAAARSFELDDNIGEELDARTNSAYYHEAGGDRRTANTLYQATIARVLEDEDRSSAFNIMDLTLASKTPLPLGNLAIKYAATIITQKGRTLDQVHTDWEEVHAAAVSANHHTMAANSKERTARLSGDYSLPVFRQIAIMYGMARKTTAVALTRIRGFLNNQSHRRATSERETAEGLYDFEGNKGWLQAHNQQMLKTDDLHRQAHDADQAERANRFNEVAYELTLAAYLLAQAEQTDRAIELLSDANEIFCSEDDHPAITDAIDGLRTRQSATEAFQSLAADPNAPEYPNRVDTEPLLREYTESVIRVAATDTGIETDFSTADKQLDMIHYLLDKKGLAGKAALLVIQFYYGNIEPNSTDLPSECQSGYGELTAAPFANRGLIQQAIFAELATSDESQDANAVAFIEELTGPIQIKAEEFTNYRFLVATPLHKDLRAYTQSVIDNQKTETGVESNFSTAMHQLDMMHYLLAAKGVSGTTALLVAIYYYGGIEANTSDLPTMCFTPSQQLDPELIANPGLIQQAIFTDLETADESEDHEAVALVGELTGIIRLWPADFTNRRFLEASPVRTESMGLIDQSDGCTNINKIHANHDTDATMAIGVAAINEWAAYRYSKAYKMVDLICTIYEQGKTGAIEEQKATRLINLAHEMRHQGEELSDEDLEIILNRLPQEIKDLIDEGHADEFAKAEKRRALLLGGGIGVLAILILLGVLGLTDNSNSGDNSSLTIPVPVTSTANPDAGTDANAKPEQAFPGIDIDINFDAGVDADEVKPIENSPQEVAISTQDASPTPAPEAISIQSNPAAGTGENSDQQENWDEEGWEVVDYNDEDLTAKVQIRNFIYDQLDETHDLRAGKDPNFVLVNAVRTRRKIASLTPSEPIAGINPEDIGKLGPHLRGLTARDMLPQIYVCHADEADIDRRLGYQEAITDLKEADPDNARKLRKGGKIKLSHMWRWCTAKVMSNQIVTSLTRGKNPTLNPDQISPEEQNEIRFFKRLKFWHRKKLQQKPATNQPEHGAIQPKTGTNRLAQALSRVPVIGRFFQKAKLQPLPPTPRVYDPRLEINAEIAAQYITEREPLPVDTRPSQQYTQAERIAQIADLADLAWEYTRQTEYSRIASTIQSGVAETVSAIETVIVEDNRPLTSDELASVGKTVVTNLDDYWDPETGTYLPTKPENANKARVARHQAPSFASYRRAA